MTRARHPRAFLWLLLAAALFTRAFLPQGYMPEQTDGGTITVRVCGSNHLVQIPLGKGEGPAKSERAEPPCTFAGLGTPALAPPVAAELPPPTAAGHAFAHGGDAPAELAFSLPHPPARGPPLAA